MSSNTLFLQKNKDIVIDLYQYYFNGGFQSIITDKITRLLISCFMIFLYNFLINCIDYHNILYLSTSKSNTNTNNTVNYNENYNKSIYDFINISVWLSLNPYLMICFCLYCIYLFFLTMNVINTIKKFSRIREIYKKYLKINDYRIKFITWDDIVNSVINRLLTYNDLLDSSNISIYTVNNKICYQSNIIISVIRNGYVLFPKYSKFLEWNFIFCIIDPIITTIKHNSARQSNTHHTNNTHRNNYLVDSETVDDIQYYNNKDLYNLYKQPLLSVQSVQSINSLTQSETNEIEDIERNIITAKGNTNPFISETELPSPITHFDNVLYNTLTENIRGDVGSDSNAEINYSIMDSTAEYIDKVHYRIQLVFWINLLCIPFTVIILGLYLIIKYGEQIYRNPGLLFQRQINIATKWKLRFYNEIPNLYAERISRIECNLNKIVNTYNSTVRMVIVRFLTFIIGSLFLIVLVLSFIASEEFSQLDIIPKHNVIWFLGVSGTILLILNKLSYNGNGNGISGSKLTKAEQITAFDALREDLITVFPQLYKVDDREYLVTLIHNIYKPRIVNMMNEMVNLLLSPYYLWIWRKEIAQNANMILGLIENHYILGSVCRHSIFTNHDELVHNPHMLLSLKEFKINHRWTLPSVLQINPDLTNSALLQQTILHQ